MMKIWVVVSNSNVCHIYQYQKKPSSIKLIKTFSDPQAKLRSVDLASDIPGRYQSSGSPKSAFEPQTTPKEVEIEHFSHEVTKELNLARAKNLFEQLILIASPSMSGILLGQLDKQTKNLIFKNIQKDFQHISEKELLEFLQENAKFKE